MKDNLDTSSNQSKHLITMNEKKDLGAGSSNSGVSPVVSLTSTAGNPIEQFKTWLDKRIKATHRKCTAMQATNDKIRLGSKLTVLKQVLEYTNTHLSTTPTATPVAQRGLTSTSCNSIRLLTALLSGKRLARKVLNDDNCIQILWCEWFKEKPYFYVSGWGSAFGNAIDRVIGIIETNGDGWRIDSPNAQGSDTTMPNRSSEPLLTKSNTGGEQHQDKAGPFNEISLQEEIYKVWGRHGAHADVYGELLRVFRQHQDKAGEELFHWVKASERLPESGGYYFVRMGELKDKYVWPRLKIATLVEDNSSIEWLEKMPQSQSVQGSDTRGDATKDESSQSKYFTIDEVTGFADYYYNRICTDKTHEKFTKKELLEQYLRLPPSPRHQGEGELAVGFAEWSSEHFRRAYPTQAVYPNPEGKALWFPNQPISFERKMYDTAELFDLYKSTHLAAQGTGSEGGK